MKNQNSQNPVSRFPLFTTMSANKQVLPINGKRYKTATQGKGESNPATMYFDFDKNTVVYIEYVAHYVDKNTNQQKVGTFVDLFVSHEKHCDLLLTDKDNICNYERNPNKAQLDNNPEYTTATNYTFEYNKD